MHIASCLSLATWWLLTVSSSSIAVATQSESIAAKGETAAVAPVSAPSTAGTFPLLAYAGPKQFLGLEPGAFSKRIDTVMFIPRFHQCGTLLVISIPGLLASDFDLLPKQWRNETSGELIGSGLKDAYDRAPSQLVETNADDEQVVNWSRGWSKTCGPGPTMKEVRVAKIQGDLDDEEGTRARKEAIVRLDQDLAAHISALPEPPHPHLVVLTTLSPKALMAMLDISSHTSHPPPKDLPSSPSDPTKSWPKRPKHGLLATVFWGLFRLLFWTLVLGGLGLALKQFLEHRKLRRRGWFHVSNEERDIDLEAE